MHLNYLLGYLQCYKCYLRLSTLLITECAYMETTVALLNDVTVLTGISDMPVLGDHGSGSVVVGATAIIYIVIGILGIFDNGLVVVTILSSKSMRGKVCNMLILNQTILDLAASMFLVVNCPPIAAQSSPAGILGEIYCRLWVSNYFLWVSLCGSTFNLVAITIERYFEVVHPLTYKNYFNARSVRIIIASVWTLALAYLLVSNVYPSTTRDGVCINRAAFPSHEVATAVSITTFLLTFAIPVIIMIICYSRMILALRSKVDPNKQNLSEAERRREEKMARVRRNLLKTMITVAVAFFACWVLNQMLFLLFNLGVPIDLGGLFVGISIYLVFINSCINPFIYTYNYSEFQTALKKLLRIKSSSDLEASGTVTTMT